MKKVVLIAMLLGFLVAASIGLMDLYSYHHGDRTPTSDFVRTITLCLWPTIFLIPLDASYNAAAFIAVGISALANGILYGIVAFVISFVWKNVFTPKSRREQAQGWWPGSRRGQ